MSSLLLVSFLFQIPLVLGLISGCEDQIKSELNPFSDGYAITFQTNLPDELTESSGLLYIDTFLISFNDSGNDPILYALSPASGEVFHTWKIDNVANKDWEDICMDENFVYIGDFGNNLGTRKDLNVLKISKDSLLRFSVNNLTAKHIEFSFEDQESFIPTFYNHSFDCESIISFNDSLVVFSKDWKNKITTAYIFPKEAGKYVAKKIGQFNVNCFITGADFNVKTNQLLLTGYSDGVSCLWRFNNITENNIFGGSSENFNLTSLMGIQNEGIAILNNDEFYLSCETQHTPARLYKIKLN